MAQVAALTDAQLYGVYLCPRDKDGRPDWSAYRGAEIASARPLPSAEELRIPPEAFAAVHTSGVSGQAHAIPSGLVLAWWWAWRGRQEEGGYTDAELLAKWREYVEKV